MEFDSRTEKGHFVVSWPRKQDKYISKFVKPVRAKFISGTVGVFSAKFCELPANGQSK